MTYEDFLRIAEYGNKNWKGSFTKNEVRQNAEDYYADFLWSRANDEIAESIKSLCRNLMEDLKTMPDLEEPKHWLEQIESELGEVL